MRGRRENSYCGRDRYFDGVVDECRDCSDVCRVGLETYCRNNCPEYYVRWSAAARLQFSTSTKLSQYIFPSETSPSRPSRSFSTTPPALPTAASRSSLPFDFQTTVIRHDVPNLIVPILVATCILSVSFIVLAIVSIAILKFYRRSRFSPDMEKSTVGRDDERKLTTKAIYNANDLPSKPRAQDCERSADDVSVDSRRILLKADHVILLSSSAGCRQLLLLQPQLRLPEASAASSSDASTTDSVASDVVAAPDVVSYSVVADYR